MFKKLTVVFSTLSCCIPSWEAFAGVSTEMPVIQTMEMASINPETCGIDQGGETSIPITLWQGLTHAQMMNVLRQLPNYQTNSLLALLQRRFLLASAQVPSKGKQDTESGLSLRVAQLEKSGNIISAYQLASEFPEGLELQRWNRIQFAYYLGLDNYNQALSIARKALQQHPEDTSWIQAVIGINLLKGEKEAADMALSLLEEQGDSNTKAFRDLAHAYLQGVPFAEDFSPQTVLEKKLWVEDRLARHKRIPDEMLELALMGKKKESLKPKERLSLVERAFQRGMISQEDMTRLYQEFLESPALTTEPTSKPFSDLDELLTTLTEPLPVQWKRDDPLLRSHLLRSSQQATAEEKKAFLLGQWARNLVKYGVEDLGFLGMKDLLSLQVLPEFKNEALFFCCLLLYHQQNEKAMQWLSLLSLEEKIMLAPWIILLIDDLKLEAKQALFSHWMNAFEKDARTLAEILRAIEIFEAIVPGVTQYYSLSIPLPLSNQTETRGTTLLGPLHFALPLQHGVALAYALMLGKEVFDSPNASLAPFVITALKSLGYDNIAKRLALGFFKGAGLPL